MPENRLGHYCWLNGNSPWVCSRCDRKWVPGDNEDWEAAQKEICAFTKCVVCGVDKSWCHTRIRPENICKHTSSWHGEPAELFSKRIKAGDEVWLFRTPESVLNRGLARYSRSGIAIVRGGKVWDTLQTGMHMMSVIYYPEDHYEHPDLGKYWW